MSHMKIFLFFCLFFLACSAKTTESDSANNDILITDAELSDTGLTDSVQADTVQDKQSADEISADISVNQCGAFGLCQESGQISCGSMNFIMTEKGCVDKNGKTGSCCIPKGECQNDSDCPDCKLCELTRAGQTICVDPFGETAIKCTKKSQCPEQYCCSFIQYQNKPECGGICVYDGGRVECDSCQDQGSSYYPGDLPCCPWLNPVPMTMAVGDGNCIPGRAIGSKVCVKKCGDGECTKGEDSCNCPKDCSEIVDKGPGAKCTKDADCKEPGSCLPETSGYAPGGYCTGGTCNHLDTFPCTIAGTICAGTIFSEAYLCLPSCHDDADCHTGLTCEALPELPPGKGEYICWQSGKAMLGMGLGKTCTKDDECISKMCLKNPKSGQKVCSAYCTTDRPCKKGQTCSEMAGCSLPPCGACFTM
jgi:hypothetical protein